MTPDEFRAAGHDAVEWVARYLEEVETFPVASQVEPGSIMAALPASPPEDPEPFQALLDDLDSIVVPGLTHWQSPNFFAYFPANASPPSVLGELLSAGLGVQGMLWSTSPACTEVETRMLDWVLDLTGLPDRFRSDGPGGGVIHDSASSATLAAILTARDRCGGAANLGRLTVYASTEAHSSITKGARVAGFAADQIRIVPTDDSLAMDAAALAEMVAEDEAAGRMPCLVVATIGTTSTGVIDPIAAIADVCETSGAWLHVDAAWAGSAAVRPELRWINDGVERADSYCFNPHKWLLTNFDCSCFYLADRTPLIDSLRITPEYLRNRATESGAVIDYRDWQVPLGRRFRALKLWSVIRSYGASGLRDHIGRHVDQARMLEQWVDADDRYALSVPRQLSLVCLHHVDGDEATQRVLDAANGSGRIHLTHTRVHGRLVMRMAIGSVGTTEEHVHSAWQLLRELA